ncbi:MAG: hypothetical protein ACYTBZ_30210 [Planctomycetota bacterium]|jgi:hypothetical protein
MAPYDFAGDPNCVALWNFENGALKTDSIGSNTWTDGGGSPQASTTIFKKGAASVYMIGDADNDWYDIPDASLDAGFPGKAGGNGTFTICYWFRLVTTPAGAGTRRVPALTKSSDFKSVFGTGLTFTPGDLSSFYLGIGYNSGNSTAYVTHASDIAETDLFGHWFHVGVTYDENDQTYRIRVWDSTNRVILGTDATGSTEVINIENSPLLLTKQSGAGNPIADTYIDQMCVFNDVKSAATIDEIRDEGPGGVHRMLRGMI